MSRGFGKVQRRVVEALSESGSSDLQRLAELVFDTPSPTASQISNMRQSLTRLCAAGKVYLSQRPKEQTQAQAQARVRLGIPPVIVEMWTLQPDESWMD